MGRQTEESLPWTGHGATGRKIRVGQLVKSGALCLLTDHFVRSLNFTRITCSASFCRATIT